MFRGEKSMEFIFEHPIISAAVTLVGISALYVTFIFKKEDDRSITKAKQKGNTVLGDQAGRDIKKHNE
jgi:hypothetical protein